jgi:putative Mg2+ transporter-C (MgtC) family protein
MNEWDVVTRMLGGLAAGGLIGLERSFHGRAAGLRTYALVSLGSALLIAVTEYDLYAAGHGGGDTSRVVQGIVTGIGFLGAGVIVKEGFTVRGLTTAASIWVASAIGVAIGAGHYLSGAAACLVTLVALSAVRIIEDRLPARYFIRCHAAFARERMLEEKSFRELAADSGFAVTELSYRLDGGTGLFEYRAVMWSTSAAAPRALEQRLLSEPGIASFDISPSRD